MRAGRLKQMISAFNPQEPLVSEETLREYFVERPRGPLEKLEDYLHEESGQVKILFTGHRGSGKSTELNQLVMDLHDQFFIVKFSIHDDLNSYDLNYIDIILTCGLKLLEKAMKDKVKINKGILKNIFEWLHYDITEEKVITRPKEAELSTEVDLLVVKLGSKLKSESITREIMRKKVGPRFSELKDKINLTIDEIKEKTSKDVLIIVEDIDKTNLNIARELFFEHSADLIGINSKVIYTFPIALRYSNDFPQITKNFNNYFVLPNVTIVDKQGEANQEGQEMLRRVILKRIEEHLITEEAIKQAIYSSGGLMIELITIIRDAALEASVKKKDVLEAEDVFHAVNEIRNNYRCILSREQYQVLKGINEDAEKRVANDEIVRDLLHNLSLLEYRNGDVWIDIHPIVKPLL